MEVDMQEFLWEIWVGKRNMHQRIQMDLNETPNAVFQRIIQQQLGTDNEIKTRTLDPNTGKEVDTKWKFSYRMKGETSPLSEHAPFGQQGTSEGALIVVRAVEIRANTIYIDGIDGLQSEEISAAANRTPLIITAIVLLVLGGLLGYYYFVVLPEQEAKAPYMLKVKTSPNSADVVAVLDVSKVEDYKKKFGIKSPYLKRGGLTTNKNRFTMKIPKKAKVIYVEVSQKGYVSWKKGVPLKEWEKAPGKHGKMDPTDLLKPGFFPEALKKVPPKPKFKKVPASKPKDTAIKYPRRWRSVRFGIDPMHGGDDKGVVGTMGVSASKANLLMASIVQKHLKSRKRRRYRLYLSRKGDTKTPAKKRARALRRAKLLLQLDLASGLEEMKKNVETIKKGDKTHKVNNGVAGFQIFWSDKNKKSKATQKWATCLGKSLKNAGFVVRPPRKDEKMTSKELGIRPVQGEAPLLSGRNPAVRVVVGYVTHQEEELALLEPANIGFFAKAVEAAIICYKAK